MENPLRGTVGAVSTCLTTRACPWSWTRRRVSCLFHVRLK